MLGTAMDAFSQPRLGKLISTICSDVDLDNITDEDLRDLIQKYIMDNAPEDWYVPF
jgi:hypothetical protein